MSDAVTTLSPFAQAAPGLIAMGLSPVPVIPVDVLHHAGRGKSPGVFRGGGWQGYPGWSKLADCPLSGFDLKLALQAPGSPGVGLVLGTPAGKRDDGTPLRLICIDIDATDHDALDAICRACPASPMSRRAAKGEARFMRASDEIISRSYDGPSGRLVDLLAKSRMAVIPPSRHRDGMDYRWLGAGVVAPEELPEFTIDDLAALEETLEGLGWERTRAPNAAMPRPVRSAAEYDPGDPWARANAEALARPDEWFPALGLPRSEQTAAGWRAVPNYRPSSSGRPDEIRKLNLSLSTGAGGVPPGIRDWGACAPDDRLSAIDLVERALDLSASDALGWLERTLDLSNDTSIVVDVEAMTLAYAERDLLEPLRMKPVEATPLPMVASVDETAREAIEPPTALAPTRETSRGRVIDLAAWTSARFVGEPPEIEWLVRDAIPLAIPAMVAAQGDAGKSMLLLDLARRVAFGASPLEGPCFGGMVEREGTAVILTAEDDAGSIHRRIANLDPKNARFTRGGERLIVVPLPDAGGPLPLVREGRRGLEATDEYKRLADQLAAIDDLSMVVFDPLQAFVHAPINEDPAAGQFTCSLLATLAARTQAAVIVAHHTRKPTGDQRKGIKTLQEAREMVRGTTALVDGLRLVYALWAEADGEARKVCQRLGVDYEANRVIRGGVVKANGPVRRRISTFVRNSTGLLIDQTMMLSEAPSERQDQMAALAVAVETAARTGSPFTRHGATGLDENRHRLPPLLQELGRDKLRQVCEEAMKRGIIVGCIAKGSTAAKWLDVPGGPIAEGVGDFALGATRDAPIKAA